MKRIISITGILVLASCLGVPATYAQAKGLSRGHAPAIDREPHRVERREVRREDRFEEHMEHNPALRSRLQNMLPPGTNLAQAESGFKNQGQFIAALHASKNLDIPFSQLQSRMTGPHPMSLGQAIHDVQPNVSSKQAHDAAERAEHEAKETEKAKKT